MKPCRIGQLVTFFNNVLRCGYMEKLGRAAFGRELAALLKQTHSAEKLWPTISLKGAPEPFELNFKMSNAADCSDWIADNN